MINLYSFIKTFENLLGLAQNFNCYTLVLKMRTVRQMTTELGKSTGGASVGAGIILPQMMSQFPPPPQPIVQEKKSIL